MSGRIGSFFAVFIGISLIFLVGCGGVGHAAGPGGTQTNGAAPTVTITANPTTVASGGAVTLTWSTTNATLASIDHGVGSIPLSGSVQVRPTVTTKYTISAEGPGGGVTAAAIVTVGTPNAPAPTIQFAVDHSTILAGQTAILNWNTTNATSVSIQPGQANLPSAGTLNVTPAQTTTYTATATGPGGTATATLTITVNPATAPTISLSANPTTVTAGQFTTLQWTSTGATTVTISPALPAEDGQQLPLTGSVPVVPKQTTTYTATATGPGGTASANVTVTVNQAAPTVTLTATPTAILPGQKATLNWTTQSATSLTIDNGVGNVAVPTGSATVTPSATTTYTATVSGPGGTATATATVTVQQQLAVTLTASPTSAAAGQPVTLTWTSQNAASVNIQPAPGPVNLNGSVTVNPAATTTYTATATDASGATQTATATVTIIPGGSLFTSIKHIIFFVQENRSFDNYFGQLGPYKASRGFANDVDGLAGGTFSQADQNGTAVHPYHQPTTCAENTSPSWNPSWGSWDNGAMDGFVRVKDQPSTIDPEYHRAMAYYDQTDLPYYYEAAAQFATSDRWFEPVMAGTIPNRMYLFAGTSFGHVFPDPPPPGGWQQRTIFENLNAAGVSWRYYYQDNSIFLGQFAAWNDPAISGHVRYIDEWYKTLADPNADSLLPSVIFIERASSWQTPTGAACGGSVSATCTSLDEHPDANAQAGAARAAQITNALLQSAAWKSSVMILTYDEYGGLFDHVPIISAPAPDNIQPMATIEPILPGDFAHTGFRIPLIVMSPWVKPHFVSHTPRDATAILKLIETRFGVSALTPRDGDADDMSEFFDFSHPAMLAPPSPALTWADALRAQPTNAACDYTLEISGQH